ncbi:hypothetical protein QVD17_14133 [Tagetes erecta]|uniref:Uncharacterized protein n=1 Tax=Tagetes erecta TaxID=13708 RepID=A0AAD8KYK6_TARER|nr:hypothetical protein QVD17_14133 [Tagetes erecta]
MSSSVITDMNLGGSKQSVNGGNGSGNGRRKTKGNDFTQKKNKQPGRGMGVAQLERLRLQDRWKTITELHPHPHPHANAHVHVHDQIPSFNPSLGFSNSNSGNQIVQFRPYPVPAPAMFGQQIHGGNLYSTDHVVDPSVIGSSSYIMKCGSDCCGVCHKKKRINGGSNLCSVAPYRNTMVDRRSSNQVTEVTSVNRNGGGSMFEFFPGKSGGAADEYKEVMRMGSPATTWCGSGGAGTLGFRGGEGSCVTAITGGEEGSVSSVDLSLKL